MLVVLVGAAAASIASATIGPLDTPGTPAETAPPTNSQTGADRYAGLLATAEQVAPNLAASTAITFAARQLGLPYVWGGNGPLLTELPSGRVQVSGGFDCSGLVQAAYGAAGIVLPRTATEQFRAGPLLPPKSAIRPGDLVFYGDGTFLHHVGIAVSATEMIDAPHTGAVVRLDQIRYQGDDFYGATRPAP